MPEGAFFVYRAKEPLRFLQKEAGRGGGRDVLGIDDTEGPGRFIFVFQIEISELFLYIEKGDIAFRRKGDAEVVGSKAEGALDAAGLQPDLRHDACMAEDAVGDLPDALLRVGEDELLLCGQRWVEKEVRKAGFGVGFAG